METKVLRKYLEKITILYVEDEMKMNLETTETLKIFSNHVLSVSNGKAALDIIKKNKIDLIITDIEMPELNGIELIKEIRKENIKIPIIILTAHTQNKYLLESVNLNIQAYIVKPISLQKLKSGLIKIIDYLSLKNNSFLRINDKINYDKLNGTFITKEDKNIPLNKKEKQLFELLLDNKNIPVSYKTIEYEIWSKNDDVMSQSALRTLIKTIRRKIQSDNIKNISGVGYKLTISDF